MDDEGGGPLQRSSSLAPGSNGLTRNPVLEYREARQGRLGQRYKAAVVTIEQLGSLGEVVGAIATIGTLWYLALQIRQSSRTERASNFVQIMQDQQVWLSIAQSEEVAGIYLRGLRDFSSLTDVEQTRFHMILSLHFSNMQLAFRLHQEGALATELYEDTFASMLNFVGNPGARNWWQSAQHWFHPDFAEHVNSKIPNADA